MSGTEPNPWRPSSSDGVPPSYGRPPGYGTPPGHGAPPGYGGPPPYATPPAYGTPPPYGYGPAPLPPGWEYASYGSRVAAYLLDAVFLFGCLLPGGILGGALMAISSDADGNPSPAAIIVMILSMFAGVGVWLWAYVWRTGTHGQSWGKRLLGIYVLQVGTLMPIGGGMGILRYIMIDVIAGATCYLGGIADVLWPLWDPQHQSLHDKVVSSVVVRRVA